MYMQFLSTDLIIGFWFASNKKHDNAQYVLIKRDDKYILEFRMRYSKSDDPFSGEDEKSFYTYSIDPKDKSEKEIIDIVNTMFNRSIDAGFNDVVDHFLVNGGAMEFLEIIKTKEYMHIKIEKVH
jgi:hypothetical protein